MENFFTWHYFSDKTQISWVYVCLEAKDGTLKCSSYHIPISHTNYRFDLCP